ncbi:MAG: hypothetical protein ACOVNY_13460 [Chitinophagaceae bacterium]
MLSKQEEEFLLYWELNRLNEKKSFKQYVKGLSVGLGISLAIIIIIASGWYQRANMVVNSKLSAFVFLIALLGIVIFMGWLYKNYKWEMGEQQYLELLAKKKKLEKQQ